MKNIIILFVFSITTISVISSEDKKNCYQVLNSTIDYFTSDYSTDSEYLQYIMISIEHYSEKDNYFELNLSMYSVLNSPKHLEKLNNHKFFRSNGFIVIFNIKDSIAIRRKAFSLNELKGKLQSDIMTYDSLTPSVMARIIWKDDSLRVEKKCLTIHPYLANDTSKSKYTFKRIINNKDLKTTIDYSVNQFTKAFEWVSDKSFYIESSINDYSELDNTFRIKYSIHNYNNDQIDLKDHMYFISNGYGVVFDKADSIYFKRSIYPVNDSIHNLVEQYQPYDRKIHFIPERVYNFNYSSDTLSRYTVYEMPYHIDMGTINIISELYKNE